MLTYNAPAGADYTGSEGLIVYESASNEATLSTNPATEQPIGVIVDVEPDAVPQRLSIAGPGDKAFVRCGGAIPPGTRFVKTSGTSEGVVSTTNFAGATWQHVLGVLIEPHGYTTVNDQRVQISIQPAINLET
jgi:hypothetical protein